MRAGPCFLIALGVVCASPALAELAVGQDVCLRTPMEMSDWKRGRVTKIEGSQISVALSGEGNMTMSVPENLGEATPLVKPYDGCKDEAPEAPVGAFTHADVSCGDPSMGPVPTRVTANERQKLIAEHNRARAELGNPPLRWDDGLARHAQGWADVLAEHGRRKRAGQPVRLPGNLGVHSGGSCFSKRHGNKPENIASGGVSVQSPIDGWLWKEKPFWKPAQRKCVGGVCGHYLSAVSHHVSRFGCGHNPKSSWVCTFDTYGARKNRDGTYAEIALNKLTKVKVGERYTVDGEGCVVVTRASGGTIDWRTDAGASGRGYGLEMVKGPCGGGAKAPDAEPKKAEPKKAEPKKAEPKKAEPKKAEPKKAEPKKAEPEKAEGQTEQKKAALETGPAVGDFHRVKGKKGCMLVERVGDGSFDWVKPYGKTRSSAKKWPLAKLGKPCRGPRTRHIKAGQHWKLPGVGCVKITGIEAYTVAWTRADGARGTADRYSKGKRCKPGLVKKKGKPGKKKKKRRSKKKSNPSK